MTIDILRDTVHNLLCDLHHEDDMTKILSERDPCKCYYYLEKSLTNAKDLPDHIYWADQCSQLMELLNTNQPSIVLSSVYKVLSLIEKITALSPPEQSLFALFYKPLQDDSCVLDYVE